MGNNELYHHGILGQKWGVRRYQNYDGTRIKTSDMILKKNTNVYRYSNKKESGSTYGAYAFKTDSDAKRYIISAKNKNLGFKDYKEIVMTKISVIDDATVRRGQDTVKDIVDKIGDVNVTKAYEVLASIGYLDDSKSSLDRNKIFWDADEDTEYAAETLASSVNKYMFNKKTSKETRDKLLDEYKKKGYDAIVDPEDFIWNMEMPLILLNNNKFKRVADGVVFDKSNKEYYKKDVEVNPYYAFTDEDRKAITKVMKKK